MNTKEVIIYKRENVEVYINKCFRNPKWRKKKIKTNIYAIRRNDDTGLASYLGGIKWSGRWRQYVFEPKQDTMWNWSCLRGIIDFLVKINKIHRKSLRL